MGNITALSQCGDCEFESENLIVNGDFESGNVDFTSEYDLATTIGEFGLLTESGIYAIGPDASLFHTNFQGEDHTNPPFGNFMVINGSDVSGIEVWCQEVAVEPDTWYSFSAWSRNCDFSAITAYAVLEWFFNDVALGSAWQIEGEWQEFTGDWYSGTATSVTICMKNWQFLAGGNDFGIDDIKLTTCEPYVVVHEPTAGDDITICSGETITIGEDPETNFNYSWDNGNGLNSTTIGNPELTLVNNGNDPITETYTLTTDSLGLGCTQTDEITVTINPLPEPDLGADIVICPGEETILDCGTGWESIEWSTSESTEQITVSTPDTYTVTVELLNCFATDEVEVAQPDFPQANFPDSPSICEDGEFTFTAPEIGEWNTGDVATSITTSTEGWYWVEFEELGCTSRDSVFLDVIEYVDFSLGDDFSLCPDDSVTLFIPAEGAWNTGSFADSILIVDDGIYSVDIANEQCISSDEIEVFPLFYPELDLGEDQSLCQGELVRFYLDQDPSETILWNDGSDDDTLWVTTPGIYSVDVSNECGSVQDTVLVFFEDCNYNIFIPNSFTPNLDGVNDNLRIVTRNVSQFKLWMFNKWGEEVWYTSDPRKFWIGDHQAGGYYVPDGTYFYRVQALTNEGALVDKFGYVTLFR